ncbi:hypothetical protein BLA24_22740 [Streptomyces cinnamoneus]|uniref:SLC26A/SulP transporter domain-containing protein n=1 Tax=Streptomyces cinnamoneus TaxID=53446 RepID=A0A2G1XEX0_STRCJ|nr:SulP family inorganic anion transporter [Streptomyces cinnamoneus]PHQ49773.1 hypothetical protein BLA24_22740 [Streptomyces cinnamoneus]PPT13884.1 SulP family inorganic anion transporter [Streptomyces cinnamoneus]
MPKSPFRHARSLGNVVARVDLRANLRNTLRHAHAADFAAALVVFFIAVPLSVGVAVATGTPVELGLVAGIVGGFLTGLLPGSSLRVTGPAAGLTLLVHETVREYGLKGLAVLVLATVLIQTATGLLRMGRWFRSVAVAVAKGVLLGIGLLLFVGQLYGLLDADAHGTAGLGAGLGADWAPGMTVDMGAGVDVNVVAGANTPAGGLEKLGGLVTMFILALTSPVAIATYTVVAGAAAAVALWPRWTAGARLVPAPLAAVALAAAGSYVLGLPVDRVRVGGLLDMVRPPGDDDFERLGELGTLGAVLAFALVASADSLFRGGVASRGQRPAVDRSLWPLHAAWLLVFATLLPWVLDFVPLAALAGVLAHAGWKSLPRNEPGPLWPDHRGDVAVLMATAAAVAVTNLFEGVVIGLLTAVVKTAWEGTQRRVRP